MTQTITLFRCRPHTVDLTRTSCGQRYEAMNRTATRTPPGPRPVGKGCVGCPVGKAHAEGERVERWDDGAPIVFTDKAISVGLITPSKPKATTVPRTVASGKPLEIPDALKVRNEDARTAAARARFDELAKSAATTEVPVLASDESPPRSCEDGAQRPHMASPPVECDTLETSPADGAQGPRFVGPPVAGVKLRTSGPLESREVEVDGKVRTVAEWATITGITISAVKQRIQKGMSPAEACTSPRSKGGRVAGEGYHRKPVYPKSPPFALPPRVMPGVELEVVADSGPIVILDEPPTPVILPVVTPEIALRAAGWEVVRSERVPAGWMLIVRETGAPQKKE